MYSFVRRNNLSPQKSSKYTSLQNCKRQKRIKQKLGAVGNIEKTLAFLNHFYLLMQPAEGEHDGSNALCKRTVLSTS